MSPELRVLIDEIPAGVLDRLSNGQLHFEYDPAYQARSAPTPLSISMPVPERSHGHARVFPFISGLLPDDQAVLRRWAQEFRVASMSPFTLLSTPIGEDCAGGVQFVKPERLEHLRSDPGRVEWLSAEDLETRLANLRVDPAAWHGEEDTTRGPGFTGRFSLAGRQRKTALLLDGDRWGVPSGRIPTTHILKPPIPGYHDQELNEHLCLDAASRAGLRAAESRVMTFGAESVIVVRRYDRVRDGDRLMRVHQEDVCQALGVPPERKYQVDGGPGPADIARLLRSVMPAQVAEESVRRFADALIWNWIVAGTDAHAKNYSLMLSGRQVRPAPLYDITSGLPYGKEHDLRLAMKIDDGYRLVNFRNPWPAIAAQLGLDPEWLTARAADLCEVAPRAFQAAASDPGVEALDRRSTARLVDLVTRRAARCAKLLA